MWNWNVKQAFVWISVDFPTPSRVSRQRSRARETLRAAQLAAAVLTVPACCLLLPQHHNSILLWDAILRSPNESLLVMKELRAEYPLTDVQKELRGRALNVTVGWDLMPIIGVLRQGGGSEHNRYSFQLPPSYQM